MTDKVYFDTDALELQAAVSSCTQNDDGHFSVILSATVFHPQGGGQPADKGVLGGANVVHVLHSDEGIVHITDAPVALGIVHMKVNEEWRMLHARYHSAGHLIAEVGAKFGWLGLKGNHRPGESRVVFDPTPNKTAVCEEQFADEVASLVAQDLLRAIIKVDGKRMVTWGNLSHTRCGGTHVQSTSQVGEVQITRVREKKGQLTVQYELGGS